MKTHTTFLLGDTSSDDDDNNNAAVTATTTKTFQQRQQLFTTTYLSSFVTRNKKSETPNLHVQQEEQEAQQQQQKLPNIHADNNSEMIKEVSDCRELMQQKDKRIKDLDNENAKLRKKVITVKQFAYSKKENFERAKKRVAELEAKLSSIDLKKSFFYLRRKLGKVNLKKLNKLNFN
jgi:hypothetical protein